MEEFQEGMELNEPQEEEEIPEPTQRRQALVNKLQAQIRSAKKFHETAFKGMKSDMQAVYLGYSDAGWSEEMYVANLLQRHVHQRTAALYAKNPKPVASRRTRMDYQIWDEDPMTLAKAYSEVKAAEENNVPPGPQAAELVQEYESVKENRRQMDKVSKSLELL